MGNCMGNCVGAGENTITLEEEEASRRFQQREENEAALFKGGLAPSAVAAYGGALRDDGVAAHAQDEEPKVGGPALAAPAHAPAPAPVPASAPSASPRRKSAACRSVSAGAAPLAVAAAVPSPAPHEEGVPHKALEALHNVPHDSPSRKSRARKSKSRKSRSRNSAERDGGEGKRESVRSSSDSSQLDCSLQSAVSRPPSESSMPRPASEGPLGRSWDRVQAAKVGSESRVSRGQSLVSIPAYVAASSRA
jgi:hypothetical protein